MNSAARKRMLGVALVAALVAAMASGCSRQAGTAPATNPQPAPTAAVPSTSTTPSATTGSTQSTPSADAAGAAMGSSLTVGSSQSTQKPGPPRPSDAAAIAAAERLLHETGDIGTVQSATVRGMTQNKKGDWWVLIAIDDDLAGKDQAVLTYNGKKWVVMVFGEGVSNDDLPPDVRF